MVSKTIALTLILIGIAGLASALLPTRKICHIKHDQTRSWKILGALIVFFISGYAVFGYLLLLEEMKIMVLVVSSVLCGGGIFVAIVSRMSMLTIQNINRIAALERHRAHHDELTDLPNRTLLHERIYYAIQEAGRRQGSLAVLVMDLDRFKEVNDALGHHYGDYLLQLVAPRIRTSIRESDTVSRLGGDEFAVVLPGVGAEQAIRVAEKIARNMEEPFIIEGRTFRMDISIGIALYPQHGTDSESLLQHADVAMYATKRSTTRYTIYAEEYDEYTIGRLIRTEELRTAINKNELFLLYQPIIDLDQHAIYGAEALVRWRPPGQKEIRPPDEFITLAEQTGLIRQLTYWVLENAMKQMAAWKEEGVEINISVNLSALNLQDLDFPRHFGDLLRKWRISPSTLTLEITESSVMINPERSLSVISKIHEMGVSFSIDDFGTGYFPFANLKQLPIKAVKIDKSFILGMLHDELDAAIVRTTIDLAFSSTFRPIAEGIENARLLREVENLGCRTVQGFYLSPPITGDKLLAHVRQKTFANFPHRQAFI